MNSNILKYARLRRFTTLIFAASIIALSSSSYAGIGDSIERGLGNQIAREIEAETGVVQDPVLSAWVANIGKRLAQAQKQEDINYSFKILDSEDVNACAVPGGYVYVTKGLLRFAKSEDEIAAVLGHEVGHVAAHHSMDQLKAQILGSLVLSVFRNKKYSTAVGGAKLAGLFAMLKFSRDNEREADILGLHGATTSGYDSRRMLDFFDRMKEKEKGKVSRVESYLMTHPPFSERIEILSKQPEMQETADNLALTGDGLAQRKLYEQARVDYDKALKRSPGMPKAKAGLSRLPSLQYVKSGKPNPSASIPDLPDKSKSTELRTQLAVLEKRQSGLQKQLKSAISSLSFASNLISEYDYTSIRVFQLAVEDVNLAAKVIENISDANASIRDSLDEINTLSEQLPKFGTEADGIRKKFGKTASGVLSTITAAQPEQEKIIKRSEQACRSIDFAARQLTSTLMMPRTTEIGAAGLVETQLQMAKKNISQELLNSKTSVLNLEEARCKLVVTRINLQTCKAGDTTMQSYAERAAEYLDTDGKTLLKDSRELGTAVIDSYKASYVKIPSTGKQPRAAVDYDSANIMLNLLSWDIDREQKAADTTRGTK